MCSEGLVEAYIEAVAPVPIWVYGSRPGPVWVKVTRDEGRGPRGKLLAEDERSALAVAEEARAWMAPYRRAMGGYSIEPCTAVAIVRTVGRHLGAHIQDDRELRQEADAVAREFEQAFARSGVMAMLNRGYKEHRTAMVASGKNAQPYPRWIAARKVEMLRISALELRRVKIADFAGPGGR